MLLLTVFVRLTPVHSTPVSNRPIILLDAAGHAGDVGRWLVEGYERAQTLQFAQAFKKELLKKYKFYTIISRSAGEKILPLQIPSFANRLGAHFVLRINFYREESEKPKLFFYHLLFNPMVDIANRDYDYLSFTPLHHAHFSNIAKTKIYGNKMYEYLNQTTFKRYFDCHPLRGMPLRALIGMTAPAVLLEIGICREKMWKSLVGPIVESLSFLKGELCGL
jgi:hypothetical protein